MRWYELKSWALQHVRLSHDAMHIHLGLILFFALLWIPHRASQRVLWAWFGVLVATLINEAFDGYDWYLWTDSVNWLESTKDIINTMFWPTVAAIIIKLGQRRRPLDDTTCTQFRKHMQVAKLSQIFRSKW